MQLQLYQELVLAAERRVWLVHEMLYASGSGVTGHQEYPSYSGRTWNPALVNKEGYNCRKFIFYKKCYQEKALSLFPRKM
jgi:hypothetical protein